MKAKIFLLILTITLSCGKSEEKKSREQIKEELYKDTKSLMDFEDEKISLLAIAKQVPAETLKSILIEYYVARDMSEEITTKDYENIVATISTKFHLPKTKVASLIYNFEYELLTRDEIFEIEAEKREVEEAAQQEPPEPY